MRKSFFKYKNIYDLKNDIKKLELNIPVTDDVYTLKESITLNGKKIPNRLCANPMEGYNAKDNGNLSDLTYRRYKRLSSGGAGLIWVEATAVVPEGRTNPHQLWINNESKNGFKKLVQLIKQNSINDKNQKQDPFIVLQLTHSGRQSKPTGKSCPIITHHSKILDPKNNLSLDYPLISDDELDKLQDKFVEAAKIACECGFDAVDVKACHGYLIHELLFSHTREKSRYGGSFENRTRFLREVVKKIKKAVPKLIVTSRLNIYDGIPYPWGWGVRKDETLEPDLSEPVRLIREFQKLGVNLINMAVGNPYYNPHLERPYDHPIVGGYLPKEHPLRAISRIIKITCELNKKVPETHLVGTGLSWLRQFFPNVGAAMIQKGWISFLGMGRCALADPHFANQLFQDGRLDSKKTCTTCSSCAQMLRDGGPVGCPTRDFEVYGPIYKAGRLKNEQYLKEQAKNG